jgi:hypothetical protein
MRTAVIRVTVDPGAALAAARWSEFGPALREQAAAAGLALLDDAAQLPRDRAVRFLGTAEDAAELGARAVRLCAQVLGTAPELGTITYLSRGTDADALGVLAGLGVRGVLDRVAGDDGYDIVAVRVPATDLARVPESRVRTALEAALNCEVRILTTDE